MSKSLSGDIKRLAHEGDASVAAKKWSEALRCYRESLRLLPVSDHRGIYGHWLFVAIGETSFLNGEYQSSVEAFTELFREKEIKRMAPLAIPRFSEALYKAGKREESAVIHSQSGANYTLEDFDDPVYWKLGAGLTIRSGAIDSK